MEEKANLLNEQVAKSVNRLQWKSGVINEHVLLLSRWEYSWTQLADYCGKLRLYNKQYKQCVKTMETEKVWSEK